MIHGNPNIKCKYYLHEFQIVVHQNIITHASQYMVNTDITLLYDYRIKH